MGKSDARLKLALKKLDKQGIKVQTLSNLPNMHYVPTGSLALDTAIGHPGYPCGLITEIVGPESVGKSILTLAAAANVTRRKKYVVRLDLDKNYGTKQTNQWSRQLGVDDNYVIQLPPDEAEKITQGTITLLKDMGKELELVIIDPVSKFVTTAMDKKDMGQSVPASSARLLHQFFDKLTIHNDFAAVLAINQHSAQFSSFGSYNGKGGGGAMRYDPVLSLHLTSQVQEDAETDVFGAKMLKMCVEIKKNKLSRPKRIANLKFDLVTGGFDLLSEVVDLAVEKKVIRKSPPYYYINDKPFQGLPKLQSFLLAHPKVLAKIIEKVTDVPVDVILGGLNL